MGTAPLSILDVYRELIESLELQGRINKTLIDLVDSQGKQIADLQDKVLELLKGK